MNIPATQIRNGMIIIYNAELHRVHEASHRTPGNLRAFMQVRMRNLRNGSMIDHRFSSNDRVEKASLDTHEMEYLYSDPAGHHFMNQETYDQITLPDETGLVVNVPQFIEAGTRVKIDTRDDSYLERG